MFSFSFMLYDHGIRWFLFEITCVGWSFDLQILFQEVKGKLWNVCPETSTLGLWRARTPALHKPFLGGSILFRNVKSHPYAEDWVPDPCIQLASGHLYVNISQVPQNITFPIAAVWIPRPHPVSFLTFLSMGNGTSNSSIAPARKLGHPWHLVIKFLAKVDFHLHSVSPFKPVHIFPGWLWVPLTGLL